MEEENVQTAPLSMEEELTQIEARQRELKEKLAQASQEKVTKTIEALSQRAKEREEAEVEERRVLEEIARRKREREEEAARLEAERAKQAAAERAEREAQLQREKAEREQKQFEDMRLKAAKEQAAKLEAQLKKLQQEIEAGIALAESGEQAEVPSITNSSHPLSKLFGGTQSVAPSKEIDTVELAKEQAKQVAKKSAEWQPSKKSAGNRFVDTSSSYELEKLLWSKLRFRGNPQRLDALTAVWEFGDISKGIDVVIERAQGNPFGFDQFMAWLEMVLEQAANGQPS
jgi:hypothetical protein